MLLHAFLVGEVILRLVRHCSRLSFLFLVGL